jgi:hypothetical protein
MSISEARLATNALLCVPLKDLHLPEAAVLNSLQMRHYAVDVAAMSVVQKLPPE